MAGKPLFVLRQQDHNLKKKHCALFTSDQLFPNGGLRKYLFLLDNMARKLHEKVLTINSIICNFYL